MMRQSLLQGHMVAIVNKTNAVESEGKQLLAVTRQLQTSPLLYMLSLDSLLVTSG